MDAVLSFKKPYLLVILIALLGTWTCVKNDGSNSISKLLIDKEQALQIAEEDARRVYRDLTIYTVTAVRKDKKWYVDYNITDPYTLGGGPHYVILSGQR